ncbi:MAG: hypothetical protein AAF708_17350 [Deinococcota bacterium]
MNTSEHDAYLCEVLLAPIQKCKVYKPAFGQANSTGLSLTDFQILYGQDLFYSWLGLDDASVYAAHKAAGGLTSVYRQLGIGSERLFRAVIGICLELSEQQMNWHYIYNKPAGRTGRHTLDACIKLADLNEDARRRFVAWLETIGGSSSPTAKLEGVVFEVRQGYKSADSKRQNADLRYGVRAYQAGLLPAFAIMSSQVSDPVIKRYRHDGMLVLTGIDDNTPTKSTFAFFKTVVGYDLAYFFKRNAGYLKGQIHNVVQTLLNP